MSLTSEDIKEVIRESYGEYWHYTRFTEDYKEYLERVSDTMNIQLIEPNKYYLYRCEYEIIDYVHVLTYYNLLVPRYKIADGSGHMCDIFLFDNIASNGPKKSIKKDTVVYPYKYGILVPNCGSVFDVNADPAVFARMIKSNNSLPNHFSDHNNLIVEQPTSTNDHFKNRNVKLQSRISELQEENLMLQNVVDDLREENSKLNIKLCSDSPLVELQEENLMLQNVVNGLREENSRLNDQLCSKKEQLPSYVDEEGLINEIEALKNALRNANAKLNASEKRYKDLETESGKKIKDLESEVENLTCIAMLNER